MVHVVRRFFVCVDKSSVDDGYCEDDLYFNPSSEVCEEKEKVVTCVVSVADNNYLLNVCSLY